MDAAFVGGSGLVLEEIALYRLLVRAGSLLLLLHLGLGGMSHPIVASSAEVVIQVPVLGWEVGTRGRGSKTILGDLVLVGVAGVVGRLVSLSLLVLGLDIW